MKVSCKTIAAMISRNNKHLIFDIADVVEWVGEAIVNIGQFDTFKRFPPKEGEFHTITNHRVLLPCHIYRLLGVYRHNVEVSATEFTRNGPYLDFHRWDNEPLQFDYIGIDVDEEGYPYVDRTQLQACYWYCLKMLYLEDFINQDHIIIGGYRPATGILKQMYTLPFPNAKIIKTDSTYAELIKYISIDCLYIL